MNADVDSATPPQPAAPGLRGKVFQGGAAMMGRQLVTMGLSLISLLMITRIIGPAAYGPYVAAFSIAMYAQNLGQAGIGVYLVRAAGEVDDSTWNVAATLLLAIAMLVMVVVSHGGPCPDDWGIGVCVGTWCALVTLCVLMFAAAIVLFRSSYEGSSAPRGSSSSMHHHRADAADDDAVVAPAASSSDDVEAPLVARGGSSKKARD